MICTKCGKRIKKGETTAYFKSKLLCQDCYIKRNNKPTKQGAMWLKLWAKGKK